MTKVILHLFVLTVLLMAGLNLSTASEEHWGYPDLDKDEAYPSWGGVCDTGNRQSPINLSKNGALKGLYDDLELDNYDDPQKGVTMVNNGHTIQLSGFPIEMELKGGPLRAKYVVEQIHIHWWSEHTIDSVRYPLEVHIVHRNRRYKDMTDATSHKDGVAVLAVLYHVSNQRNDAIDDILEHLDDVKDSSKINIPIQMDDPLTVEDLFPDIDGYFTYPGSLTTPNCAEAVTWLVLQKSFPVTLDQVDQFSEVEYAEDKQLKNNYRNLQPGNNRPIITVDFDDMDGDNDDDAAVTVPAFSMATLLGVGVLLRYLQ